MPRLAIGIEYDGTGFSGWQRQQQTVSIQATVEDALSQIADERISVEAAGRTDAGVHAMGQVAHFDTQAKRASRAWLLGGNSNLPPGVNLTWVREVSPAFNARYSAVARTYQYVILNRPARSGLYHHRAWWLPGDVDVGAMQTAAPVLLGEHDFSAFRAAECQGRTPFREIQHLGIRRSRSFIVVECRANAFLHHMVRNIVGSLVHVGRGDAPPAWLGSVLESRDRRTGGMTAPAWGLYLTRVHYPAELGLPMPEPFRPGDPAP